MEGRTEAAAVKECRATAGRKDSLMTQCRSNISSESRVQRADERRCSRHLQLFGLPLKLRLSFVW